MQQVIDAETKETIEKYAGLDTLSQRIITSMVTVLSARQEMEKKDAESKPTNG